MNCKDCIFFLDSNPKYSQGECRRFPPTVTRVQIQRDGYQENDWDISSPVVSYTHWCGEYKDMT